MKAIFLDFYGTVVHEDDDILPVNKFKRQRRWNVQRMRSVLTGGRLFQHCFMQATAASLPRKEC